MRRSLMLKATNIDSNAYIDTFGSSNNGIKAESISNCARCMVMDAKEDLVGVLGCCSSESDCNGEPTLQQIQRRGK
jgi:hypothetical protein